MTLSRRRITLLLLLIVAIAAFLRLWQLDDLPPGLYHDEAYNGLDALSLVQGKTFPQFYEGWELYAQEAHGENPPEPTRWPVFFEGNYGREPLHIYLMALSIWLLEPSPFAVRLVPALAGVAAVLTTFLAATELFREPKDDKKRDQTSLSQWIPLLAAFFVAVLYAAVHFSRFGIRPMLFVPIETLTVYFFWRGLNQDHPRWRSRVNYLLAGLFLGLGLYTYASARLFPILFVLFVLIWFWRERETLRKAWINVGLMALVSLVTALPLLIFFLRYPYFFVFRLAYVANRGKGTVAGKPWLTWLYNIGRVVSGLFWQGETHLRHNLPGRPYLDVVQAGLFLLGIIRSGRFLPNLRQNFLLLWLVVLLLPTVLSGDAPHFGRMTGAVPAIAILIAAGLAWLGEKLEALAPNLKIGGQRPLAGNHRFSLAVLVILMTASLFFTGRDYFARYAVHPQLETDFYLSDWQLGKYAASQTPQTVLYLSPTQEELATIYFALADPERLRDYSGIGVLPAGIPGEPALYLLRPGETSTQQALQAALPEGILVDIPEANAMGFAVPAAAERIHLDNEVHVTWAGQIKLIGWSGQWEDNGLRIVLAWQAAQVPALDYTAFVHVLGENGRIVAQHDKPPAGFPTGDWRSGEIVVDSFLLPLPDAVDFGEPFTLQTGFYDPATLTRLGEPFVLTDNLARDLDP